MDINNINKNIKKMNKKIEPCENQEFLPKEVAESEKANLDTAQKNVLGTLCFYYLNHSIYAAEHDGWFFKDQKTLFEESNLSPAEGKRVLLKLVYKRLVERTSGTNHKCTLYRLHQSIRELMPQNPEVKIEFPEDKKIANEPLEKKRLDESRKDESSQEKKREKNVALETAFEEAAPSQQDVKAVLEKFNDDVNKAKTKQELEEVKDKLIKSGIKIPEPYHELADRVFDHYRWRCVTIGH